jgi:hypothetical protein
MAEISHGVSLVPEGIFVARGTPQRFFCLRATDADNRVQNIEFETPDSPSEPLLLPYPAEHIAI